MGFWIFMLIMVILIPIVMITFGLIFLYSPPKEINSFYGYRTPMSMKSKKTWEYAHNLLGKLWLIVGLITLAIAVVPMIFVMEKSDNLIGVLGTLLVLGELVPLIVPVFPVEAGLRRNFDQKGKIKKPKD